MNTPTKARRAKSGGLRPDTVAMKREKPLVDLLFTPLWFLISIAYSEIFFHILVLQNGFFSYTVLMAIPFSILVGTFCDLFREDIARKLRYVFTGLIFLLFATQIVYNHIFSSFMSWSLIGLAGNVVQNFLKSALIGIFESIPKLLVLAVPLIALPFAHKFIKPWNRFAWKKSVLWICVFAVCQVVLLLILPIGGKTAHTAYDLYYNNWDLELGMNKLGVISSTLIDVKRTVFGNDDPNQPVDRPVVVTIPVGDETNPAGGDTGDDTSAGDPSVVDQNPFNTIEGIDFASLSASASSEELKYLFDYLGAVQPTKKNKYTGMFKDYNLIMICAEAFAPTGIVESVTPTLYRLANSGFVFSNYWTCYPSVTTNGEYSFLTGLFPDLAKPKTDGTFLYTYTQHNTMNTTIASWFKAQGAQALAYHPHTGTYYSRNLTHTSLGYVFKAKEDYPALTGWPESDLVLAQQCSSEFIGKNQRFLVYIMTVSGHHNYLFDGNNDIALKNKSLVSELDMEDNAKAYVACNVELDRMLEYLIKELEKSGELDKTVICLSTDHYPYGLTDDEYAHMLGYKKASSMKYDRMERYASTLILWNSAMGTVKVDKPCCTVDVLPTLLNLFGMEYDSRLYSGQDILSDSYGLAMLSNQSFITDKIAYNSRYNKVYYIDKSWKMPDGYLDAYIQIVSNRFSVASSAVNNDFYKYLPQDVIAEAQKK